MNYTEFLQALAQIASRAYGPRPGREGRQGRQGRGAEGPGADVAFVELLLRNLLPHALVRRVYVCSIRLVHVWSYR